MSLPNSSRLTSYKTETGDVKPVIKTKSRLAAEYQDRVSMFGQ